MEYYNTHQIEDQFAPHASQESKEQTSKEQTWKKVVLAGLLGITTISMGACSTTPTQHVSAAPISYKADQGKLLTASTNAPYTNRNAYAGRSTYDNMSQSPRSSSHGLNQTAPRASAPTAQPYRPEAFVPTQPKTAPQHISPVAPTAKAELDALPTRATFDQSNVDTDLYKHQRVGKRYTIMGKSYTPKHTPYYNVVGVASWYGDKFHGKKTATGELYDMDDLTAAHKTLPLNSMVYVTNMQTGKGMMVRVNDRGPFVDDRIIDLSRASARALGMFDSGLGRVRVQYAGPADPMAAKTNKKPIARPTTDQVRKSEKAGQVAEWQNTVPKPSSPSAPSSMDRLVPKAQKQALEKLAPSYKPLRDLGQRLSEQLDKKTQGNKELAQQAALPEPDVMPSSPKAYVNPLLQGSERVDTAPTQPSTSGELSYSNPSPEDGPITLTIKGPIHMASHRKNDKATQAKFIAAVHYTKK